MKKNLLLLVGLLLACSPISAAIQPLKWEVGYAKTENAAPEKFIPAVVPGAVQLDIAKAENYPPYEYSDNYKMFGWMEDMYYTYRTSFPRPALKEGQRLFFVSKGIDYQFQIILNGKQLFAQEGMFTYVNVDLTDDLQANNELKVLVFPVPKRVPFPVDRSQASHVAKPAVSYGWDWHPRLVPLGIWDETGIEVRENAHLDDVYVRYILANDFSSASINIDVESTRAQGKNYKWTLRDAQGKQVLSLKGQMDGKAIAASLQKPTLWWPHDHGTPYLYTSTFELTEPNGKVLDKVTQQIGFRRVKLVMNEGAWIQPDNFPKGRSVPPAQFEINGRKIFAKGTNWVNPEIFPGVITKQRYEDLIDLGVKANFNMFRIWGGGIINKESFFELCDQKGIMVWEEFPLACNNYPDDPHYLSILRQEAISIIKRLRKHPCIALWCGGNELFNSWSKMTDQSLPLRLLNSLCLELDPQVPYNPTSPVMGMAHGSYVFVYQDGREVFEAMNTAHYTAYTEFGMPGASPVEVLKKIIPEKELFPVTPGGAWQAHHAFGVWVGDTWLIPSTLERYFGKAKSLEELVAQSQLLQCEGYKAIYEEARRQKPYCAMALNWCYDEPWPAAANNSLIAYPTVIKPAFYAVSNACRPVCSSARFSKFVWNEGEEFFTDIWLLNDRYQDVKTGMFRISLVAAGQKTEILTWTPKTAPENTNVEGPTARFKLPHWGNIDRFKVVIEVDGQPQYNSEYTLLYRPDRKKIPAGTPMMNQ